MGRAYTNAIVLDGTKKMQHVKGKIVLVEDSLITDIVPQAERPWAL
jgi:hypothetical protein